MSNILITPVNPTLSISSIDQYITLNSGQEVNINGKAFIPLLSLAILLIGYFLKNVFNNMNKLKISIIISLIVVVINLVVFFYKDEYLCLLFGVDMILLIIFLLISYKLENKYILYIYLGVMSLVLVIPTNFSDIFVTKEFYDTLDYEETNDKVKQVLDKDNSFYRMSDQSVKLDKSNKNRNAPTRTAKRDIPAESVV